jgi:hypothetical protein
MKCSHFKSTLGGIFAQTHPRTFSYGLLPPFPRLITLQLTRLLQDVVFRASTRHKGIRGLWKYARIPDLGNGVIGVKSPSSPRPLCSCAKNSPPGSTGKGTCWALNSVPTWWWEVPAPAGNRTPNITKRRIKCMGNLRSLVSDGIWRHMPPNTDNAHDKYLWTITSNFSQSTGYHSLMMDPLWSETCWSNF